jgi:hypothetical protein
MIDFAASLAYGDKNYRPTGPPTGYAGMKPFGKGRKVCKVCGHRIRGKKHEDGKHHNNPRSK